MGDTRKRRKCNLDRGTFEGKRDGAGEQHGFVVKHQKTIRVFGLESSSQVGIRGGSKIGPPREEVPKFKVNRLARSNL